VFQLALAGLAAKRMTEATGLESITIAGFLARVDSRVIEIGSLIVVDEASMVDVILLYRLQRHIPSWVRFIFLGDPSQLPPIGPGLVLHALVGLPCIPQTELKTVVRQTAQSGIPRVAAAIRAHQIPDWAAYSGTPSSGVAFVPCTQSKLVETIQKVYVELGGTGSDFNVQILSITNARLSGVRHLNRVLHGHFQAGAERINRADPDCGVTPARALDGLEFCVGDLVMFTENDYVLGLRNGSLGTILAALDVACCDDPCCVAKFDGTEYMLGSRQMNSLVHAYSITVHKSQGSEFPRVIIPISESRLLDQSLIYTAVTRGVQQVVLIGDERALCDAIRRPAIATRRYTTLRGLLLQEVPHQPLIRR
jgi:exodeoxyribonuclease V alpha subunit